MNCERMNRESNIANSTDICYKLDGSFINKVKERERNQNRQIQTQKSTIQQILLIAV